MTFRFPDALFHETLPPWQRWSIATGTLLGLAVLRALVLPPDLPFPYIPFALAVPFVAYLCGRWPGFVFLPVSGLVAIALTAVPADKLHLAAIGFALFMLYGVVIVSIVGSLQSTALAFRNSETLKQEILENQLDWVSRVDAEGLFTFINPAAARAYGLSETKDLGTDWRPIVYPEDYPAVRDLLRTISPTKPTIELDCRIRPLDGVVRWGHFTCSGYFDDDGQMTAFQSVGRDITDRKLAEARLAELNRTLESRVQERTAALSRKTEELEGFTYSLSHDLRAPLRAINSVMAMSLEDHGHELSEDVRQHMQKVRELSARMSRLMDGLLSLSKLVKSSEALQDFSNEELVASVLAGLVPAGSPRASQIIVGALPLSHGEPRLVRQVWENLLSNALKFTQHVPAPRIEVGCDPAGCVFHVRDNGAGFDMRYSEKLFQPFERLHDAAEFEGVGIGLALVARIMAWHGGRIWCESAPGLGTTFFFTLSSEERTDEVAA